MQNDAIYMQKEFHSLCNHLHYHIFCVAFQRSATVKCIHCIVNTAKPFRIPCNHYALCTKRVSQIIFAFWWRMYEETIECVMNAYNGISFAAQEMNHCLGRLSKLFMNCVSVSQSLAMEETVQKMTTFKDDNLYYHEIYNVIGRRLHAKSPIAGID